MAGTTREQSAVADRLVVRGAREHNLKDVSLDLPRDALIVFTGLSGSGKSSLAFDTIFAEGQRRYVESLSAYARQFLGQMDKPDVDFIDGLSPAVSIDQKAASRNPRSTVGTITEVYDYLRLLYARVGKPHCPMCGRPIARQTPQQIVDRVLELDEGTRFQVLALPEGTRFQVLAPIVRGRKGEYGKLLDDLARKGFPRARIDGEVARRAVRLAQPGVEDAEVVVDLGDGADGRARALARGLLLDADGRRQAADVFDLRLLHLAEELPGVRGQRLHVAPLPLGVDGVEGERALARARDACDHGQTVVRDLERNVLQVMDARAPYADGVVQGRYGYDI